MVRQARKTIPVHKRAAYEATGGVQVLGIPIVEGKGREASVDAALQKVKHCFRPYHPYLSETGREYVGELTDSQGKPLRQKEDVLARRPTKENPRLEYIQEPFEGQDPKDVMRLIGRGEILKDHMTTSDHTSLQKYTFFLCTHGCGRDCTHCGAVPQADLLAGRKTPLQTKPYGLHLKVLDYFERLKASTGEKPNFQNPRLVWFGELTNARDPLYEANFAHYKLSLSESLTRSLGLEKPMKINMVTGGYPLSDKVAQAGAELLVKDAENQRDFVGITICLFSRKARAQREWYVKDMRNVFRTFAPLEPKTHIIYNADNLRDTMEVASQILGGEGTFSTDPRYLSVNERHIDWKGSDIVSYALGFAVQPGGLAGPGDIPGESFSMEQYGIAFMPDGDVSVLKPVGYDADLFPTGFRAFTPKV